MNNFRSNNNKSNNMFIYKALFRVHKDNLLVKKQNNKNNTLKTQKETSYTLKAILIRWVLVIVLKIVSSVGSLMCLWREFQREAAATEKALSPQVWCLVLWGGGRKFVSEEWRVRDGLWWWSRSARWGGGLMSVEEYFEFDRCGTGSQRSFWRMDAVTTGCEK